MEETHATAKHTKAQTVAYNLFLHTRVHTERGLPELLGLIPDVQVWGLWSQVGEKSPRLWMEKTRQKGDFCLF